MKNTQALLEQHLSHIGKPVEEQDLTIYAETLRVEFPFAPDGHTQLLEGPEALGKFLAAIAVFTTGHAITQLETATFDGGFVIEYEESSTFRGTGRAYASRIVWTARVETGKIVRLREHYNPLRVLEALGELG
jgi:ketosteroid isomerase-like protein